MDSTLNPFDDLPPLENPNFPKFTLDNIQGDILQGFNKKAELLLFFKISNPALFREDLKNFVLHISSATQVKDDRMRVYKHKLEWSATQKGEKYLPLRSVNISFSAKGLTKILGEGRNRDPNDKWFSRGQFEDAKNLLDGHNDPEGPNYDSGWDNVFRTGFDGVIIIAGSSQELVNAKADEIADIFAMPRPNSKVVSGRPHSAVEAHRLFGEALDENREHFGFKDGISNPAVEGIDEEDPSGLGMIRKGRVLLGREGDVSKHSPNWQIRRPVWALDGSLLAFRYLLQDVIEFNKFLKENPVQPPPGHPKLSDKEASELTGARLMGRWKSGAPVALTPWHDDPKIAEDNNQVNRFNYTQGDKLRDEVACPFAAHLRKANPRDDINATGKPLELFRMIRRGIPFGKKLTDPEIAEQKTLERRGLLFISYQSNLDQGFREIQTRWSNVQEFPNFKPVEPGFDPIIGQTLQGQGTRRIRAIDPNDSQREMLLPKKPWVTAKGGEYFFTPSIPTLRDVFTVPPPSAH